MKRRKRNLAKMVEELNQEINERLEYLQVKCKKYQEKTSAKLINSIQKDIQELRQHDYLLPQDNTFILKMYHLDDMLTQLKKERNAPKTI